MGASRRSALIVGLVLALGSSGCIFLRVTQLPTETLAFPEGVIPYVLPRTSFAISVRNVLKDCSPSEPNALLAVEQVVTIAPVAEADPEQRYYIDPGAQAGFGRFWKDRNYTINSYENQSLKSFNGIVKDQAGPAIATAIGTVIKIASIAAVAPKNVQVTKKAPKPPTVCPATVVADVRKVQELVAKAGQSKKDEAAYQNALANVTVEDLFVWTPEGCCSATEGQGDHPRKSIRATTDLGDPIEFVAKWAANAMPKQRAELREAFKLRAELESESDFISGDSDAKPDGDSKTYDGFVIRNPVPSVLRVCNGACPPLVRNETLQKKALPKGVVSADRVLVPQFGPLVVMPVDNYITEESTLVVEMSPEGALTRVSMESNPTTSSTLSTINGDLDAYKSLQTDMKKARVDARNAALNAVHDASKRLSECLEAQQTIVKDGGVPIGDCEPGTP